MVIDNVLVAQRHSCTRQRFAAREFFAPLPPLFGLLAFCDPDFASPVFAGPDSAYAVTATGARRHA
jgi:hypothetical protein